MVSQILHFSIDFRNSDGYYDQGEFLIIKNLRKTQNLQFFFQFQIRWFDNGDLGVITYGGASLLFVFILAYILSVISLGFLLSALFSTGLKNLLNFLVNLVQVITDLFFLT
jgi:hypothetical protein